MPTITLVNHLVARKGYAFVHGKPSEECLNCKFKVVCIDKLRENHLYEVIRVLDIKNPCKLYDYVTTVEVEEKPITLVIPKRLALEGLKFTYKPINCSERECPNYNICNAPYVKGSLPVVVINVGSRVECRVSREAVVKAEVILAD